MPTDDSRPPGHNNDDPDDSADDVILSEQTAAPGSRGSSEQTTLTPHDLATPYVLDALELDERDAFEQHLATCEACQERVAELEESALLLPDALVTPPADLPDAFPFMLRDVAHETLPLASDPGFVDDQDGDSTSDFTEPEFTPVIEADDASGFTPATSDSDQALISEPETPTAEIQESPETETGIEIESGSEEEVVEEPAEVIEQAPVTGKRGKGKRSKKPAAQNTEDVTYPGPPARPPGRIRPGVRPANVAADAQSGSGIRNAQITPAVVAAMALGVIALGFFLWSLLLLGRVGDLEDEIAQQNEEIATLRQQANATAYTLAPTSAGPSGASGLFLFSLPDQQGALVVRGLDPAPNEWAYQIWFIEDDEPAPIAGPTFQVDENGEAVVPLTAEVASFDAVAISLEPASGSPAPTSQVILQGRLGGAAG